MSNCAVGFLVIRYLEYTTVKQFYQRVWTRKDPNRWEPAVVIGQKKDGCSRSLARDISAKYFIR